MTVYFIIACPVVVVLFLAFLWALCAGAAQADDREGQR